AGTGLRISRRGLLLGVAALGLAACRRPQGVGTGNGIFYDIPDPVEEEPLPPGLFSLGAASGDPVPDGMVLWTRLLPDPPDAGALGDRMVLVRWQIAADPDFVQMVADGGVFTSEAVGHSIHIDVSGLEPATVYYYRFTTGGQVSPVGRTMTAPAPGAQVERLEMVFATCQHYEQGHYNAWAHVAADQPDLVVFLGDYIYEGGISNSRPRRHNSAEVTTLEAYRNRYGLY